MYDVVTVGSATRDVLIKSKDFRALKDARFKTGRALAVSLGSKIKIDDIYFLTGGAGTNTAVTFARQGFKTACVVRVGKDAAGDAVIFGLKKEKINTDFVEKDKKTPTAYSVILEPKEGERTILAYRGANATLSAAGLGKIQAHWIYLSSLSGDLNILKDAIAAKKKYGVHLAWNPGGADLALGIGRLRKHLKYIDVFIVNKEEASELLGIPYGKERLIFQKFDEIIDGVAVMTLGPDGVLASDGHIMWRAGTFPERKVVDRTGAGDAFGSGFVAGLLRCKITRGRSLTEGSIIEALRVGSANATSKVEHMGAKGGLLVARELGVSRWNKLKIKKIIL
ncbi:MAG: carbohydrate kinase family protein [Candidatus Niyogibacteria bacterium]|nr:carbohydrate kinase family protein [Candidatus Niyogibacteria bacterium]